VNEDTTGQGAPWSNCGGFNKKARS
jgi:hypothetical protein